MTNSELKTKSPLSWQEILENPLHAGHAHRVVFSKLSGTSCRISPQLLSDLFDQFLRPYGSFRVTPDSWSTSPSVLEPFHGFINSSTAYNLLHQPENFT